MIDQLIEALKDTGIPFAEYAWDQRPKTNYGVISIEGAGDTLGADNRIECQAIAGTVDLFTYNNDRTAVGTIQETLDAFEGCAWYLNSVQYEDDARLIHWEWVFQLEVM